MAVSVNNRKTGKYEADAIISYIIHFQFIPGQVYDIVRFDAGIIKC